MDESEFERVAATFAAFHRRFAPLFGRPEAQRRSEQYLRGLLVQQAARRNAENLAEAVAGATPRALQRFLTESPWSAGRVIDALQAERGERLNAPDGVFVLDDSGFAKQGKRSVGVARQSSGTLGKVGNCQVGVFRAYASARGHALADARLYLPREWTDAPERCRAAGVPEAVPFQPKGELGLALLRRARAAGHWRSRWLTADEGDGEVPAVRDALDADGYWSVLEVPRTTLVFAEPVETAVPAWAGRGRKPTRPRPVAGSAPPCALEGLAAGVAEAEWGELPVADGAQGPRAYQFAARRVWECRDGLPGRQSWAVWRRNLDGSELKHYLSNAPADTPLPTLARVGALRWPIETEFEQGKGYAGLDEYEVRGWAGWHHHVALALLAGAFLLSLEQDWGEKDAPPDAAPGQPRAARAVAPPHLEPRRPAGLAGRHPAPQRPRQAGARQTSRPTPMAHAV